MEAQHVRFRIKRLEVTGRYALERRDTRHAFGFWPVYHWVRVSYHDTLKQAQDAALEE